MLPPFSSICHRVKREYPAFSVFTAVVANKGVDAPWKRSPGPAAVVRYANLRKHRSGSAIPFETLDIETVFQGLIGAVNNRIWQYGED